MHHYKNADIAVVDINLTQRGPAQHTARNAMLAKAGTTTKPSADQTGGDADSEDSGDLTEDPTGDHSRTTGDVVPGVVEVLDKDEAVVDLVTGITSNKTQSEQ